VPDSSRNAKGFPTAIRWLAYAVHCFSVVNPLDDPEHEAQRNAVHSCSQDAAKLLGNPWLTTR